MRSTVFICGIGKKVQRVVREYEDHTEYIVYNGHEVEVLFDINLGCYVTSVNF